MHTLTGSMPNEWNDSPVFDLGSTHGPHAQLIDISCGDVVLPPYAVLQRQRKQIQSFQKRDLARLSVYQLSLNQKLHDAMHAQGCQLNTT